MAYVQREKGAFFLVIILFILIVMALVLFFALQTDPIADVLENNQLLNVLLVLEHDGAPLFTDVLVYYPGSQRGALFDIPGHTGLIIKTLGRVDRIDAVYREKGLEAYKAEIESLADIEIPFTIKMNLEQFATLTDLLGGIKVFIPSPIDVTANNERYLLPSGAVQLDGDKIKTYVTYSTPEETQDGVQERMQNVVVSFLSMLNKKSAFVLNSDVFPSIAKYMDANIDSDALFKLLSLLVGIDAERLVPQTVSGAVRTVDGQNLLFPDWDGQLIKEVFKQTMSSIVSASENAHNRVYVLEIQNGTSTQNLARNTSGLLKSFGYDVLNVTNALSQDYQNTVIIDHIGNEVVAQALADIIRCKNIETAEVAAEGDFGEGDSLVDFTIILGKDFDGRYVR